MYLLKTSLLISLIESRKRTGYGNMADVIADMNCPYLVNTYEYEEPAVMIDYSLKPITNTSMKLLKQEMRNSLFKVHMPIYTKVRDEPPTICTRSCTVTNSLMANGCRIEGIVENSIIFPGVKVEEGAVVRNSIIMQDGVIEADSYLESVILDKNITVKKGAALTGSKETSPSHRQGNHRIVRGGDEALNVLFAVSECVPFVKSGGLADVAGSLPKELKRQGTDVRVILPKYGTIPAHFKEKMKKKIHFTVRVGWRNQYCGIEELCHEGITYYFVDNEYYFKRDHLYGYGDDGERYAFFTKAVLDFMTAVSYFPDVIHCHDWHTAMIPFLLKYEYGSEKGEYRRVRSLFTIHNLHFQGIMPKEALGDLFGLSDVYFNPEQLEFYGAFNFMKGGIVAADKITTVSPTYRREIQTEYFGEKLHGLLQKRSDDLIGILNGIDDHFYNPEHDPVIARNYSCHSGLAGGKKRE